MDLQIDELSKSYDGHWALHDVSLRAASGLLGVVGPNGAGKSTLLRILATLVEPTAGTARWHDLDTRTDAGAIRRILGYLPQEFGVYPRLTARQFLHYLAALKGLPRWLATRRVDQVLEQVHLTADADRRLGTYSGGMKQRVGIAQALLNNPELLIVDEPTAGLDPAERVRFRGLLASLAIDRLVILSTHIISDVEAVADRLVVLKGGRLVADVAPNQLITQASGHVWALAASPQDALRLQAQYTTSALVSQGDLTTVRVLSDMRPDERAVPVEPTLEDAYLFVLAQ